MTEERIRFLVAKPGLDGHDRGAKVVARALRDAGIEVIYTGIRQTPEMIVDSALQEDVDAIGLSILSGALPSHYATAKGKRDGAGGIIPMEAIIMLEGCHHVLLPPATKMAFTFDGPRAKGIVSTW